MNTTYGFKKQVTRLLVPPRLLLGSSLPAPKLLLALLMSMLRISLEAAWSMATVCQEAAYSEITSRARRDYVSSYPCS